MMPFGIWNVMATFQRMINHVIVGLEGIAAGGVQSWEGHIFLTVNLMKSEFCHAKVTFLGCVVGQGEVAPVCAKIEAIAKFPVPEVST